MNCGKRLISLVLCLTLVLALALPVLAAGPKIIFTADSSFVVGGTVSVDKTRTLGSVYDNGTSDVYNAYLEGNVQYYWMRNDAYYADGPSLSITQADEGCTFYCMAALYEDQDHTQQVGTIYSDAFTVPRSVQPPQFKTAALPDGKVGVEYYWKVECSDGDAVFSLGSSLPDGLYLTQHGEIEGTPTKAGTWSVVIIATPEAGADYAASAEFRLTVKGADPVATEPEPTAAPTQPATPTQPLVPEKEPEKVPDGKDPGDTTTIGAIGSDEDAGMDITMIIAIALGAVAIAAISGIIVILIKRKK